MQQGVAREQQRSRQGARGGKLQPLTCAASTSTWLTPSSCLRMASTCRERAGSGAGSSLLRQRSPAPLARAMVPARHASGPPQPRAGSNNAASRACALMVRTSASSAASPRPRRRSAVLSAPLASSSSCFSRRCSCISTAAGGRADGQAGGRAAQGRVEQQQRVRGEKRQGKSGPVQASTWLLGGTQPAPGQRPAAAPTVDVLAVKPAQLLGRLYRQPQVLLLLLRACCLLLLLLWLLLLGIAAASGDAGPARRCHGGEHAIARGLHRLLQLLLDPASWRQRSRVVKESDCLQRRLREGRAASICRQSRRGQRTSPTSP